LEEAPDAYIHFDAKDTGWTKVILKPGMNKKDLKKVLNSKDEEITV
jgi:hypothetical protein